MKDDKIRNHQKEIQALSSKIKNQVNDKQQQKIKHLEVVINNLENINQQLVKQLKSQQGKHYKGV